MNTLLLMKTLLMRKEEQEDSGIEGMIFEMSKLRLWNLMAILTRETILIGFKPLRGSLNSKITATRRPSVGHS